MTTPSLQLSMFLILWPAMMQAQITIEKYAIKFSVSIDAIEKLQAPAATSACGAVKITTEENTFSGGCAGTLVRTYHYTDTCHNAATAEQYLLLIDEQPPHFESFPDDLEVSENLIPTPYSIFATDNSGMDPEIRMTEIRENNLLKRTWIIRDACGNSAERTQNILIKGQD